MRITNTTSKDITIHDIDRGNAGEQKGIHEFWNAKADSVVPANGYIDVLDSDRVMLSTELGHIKKGKDTTLLTTKYSITGREVGPFILDGTNNIFKVQIGTSAVQSFTLPTGTSVTMADIVSTITISATGFEVEESDRFFRTSFMENITDYSEIDGDLGKGYGQRGASVLSGFLVCFGDDIITIGDGNANATLGFTEGDFTKCK